MKRYIKSDSTDTSSHVYKYVLDGKAYFVNLTDEEREAFENRYDIHLEYWRD